MEIPGDEERIIIGLAVSWASHDSYYISFMAENTGGLALFPRLHGGCRSVIRVVIPVITSVELLQDKVLSLVK